MHPAAPTASATLASLADEVWAWRASESPVSSTFLGLRRHDDRLEERGRAARERRAAALARFLARAADVPSDGLSPEERITRAVLLRWLGEDLEALSHHGWEWDLDQLDGLHVMLPTVASVQPVDGPREVDALVARLSAAPEAFAQWTADLRDGLASGRVAPRVGYDRVLAQVRGFVAAPGAAFAAVLDRIDAALPPADAAAARARVAEAVERRVAPAYRAFLAFLEGEYAGRARAEPGVASIPGGEAAYAFRVRRETTTSLPPDRIHAIGLEQLARNREEMLRVARSLGHRGDLRSFLDGLAADRSFRLPTREAVLDRYRAICARMQARLPEAFGLLPRAGCEVRALEPWREADAPGAYYLQPARDGSRPGVFYANTHRPDTWPTYDMEALSFHEAVPGHHLQIAVAQERPDLPDLRRDAGFTAYVEGWAHYAERLADEMGAYSGPLDRLGMLAAQAWRAARLVVDTGMHALRWPRARAVEVLHGIRSGPTSDVENETDRYVVWPGQALAYKIGHLAIADLRERARSRLGGAFSLRAFHDEVLRHGALPLSVLEEVLEAWDGSPAPA